VRLRRRRAVIVAGLVALATLGVASPAAAHAVLDGAEPAADEVVGRGPTEVVLRFSEPVRPVAGGIAVLDPSGRSVEGEADTGPASRATWRLPVEITAQGTHTITWRVISADGHPVAGSSTFHVGRRTAAGVAPPSTERAARALGVVGRLLTSGGLAIVVGGLLLGRPRALRRWPAMAAAGATVGAALVALGRGAEASGAAPWAAFGAVGELVADTRVGRLDAVRIGLSVVLVAVVGRRGRSAAGAAAAIVVGLAVATAAGGHAAAVEQAGLVTALDTVHLLAGVAWVGVVAVLVLVGPGDASTTRASTAASVAAPVAALTGVGLSLVHVPSLSALTGSGSGRVLVAKAVAVAAALALGVLHRRRLRSGLESLAASVGSLRTEAGALLVVLALAAVLVASPPPADAPPPRPFSGSAATTAGIVHLDVTPGAVGTNRVVVHFADLDGADRPVDVVAVSIERSGIPARSVPVRLRGRSLAESGGVSFGAPGTWTLSVRAVYRGASERATFRVVVR